MALSTKHTANAFRTSFTDTTAHGGANVRYGSLAAAQADDGRVRFTPESGHPLVEYPHVLTASKIHSR